MDTTFTSKKIFGLLLRSYSSLFGMSVTGICFSQTRHITTNVKETLFSISKKSLPIYKIKRVGFLALKVLYKRQYHF